MKIFITKATPFREILGCVAGGCNFGFSAEQIVPKLPYTPHFISLTNRLSWLSLLMIICLIGVTSVKAQVSLSPLYVKLDGIDTGQAQTTFEVFNGSTESIRFRARFQAFGFVDGMLTLLNDDSLSDDLSPYLRAAPLEFDVPPGSEQTIRIVALVPPSLLNSELRAALIVEPLTDNTPSALGNSENGVTGSVFFTYRFIAQIYATSSQGTASLNLGEVDYKTENGLRLNVLNSGTVSGISNITWELNQGSRQIAVAQDAARFTVLPKDSRVGMLAEGLQLPSGEYTLTGTFGTEDGGEPPVVLNPQPFTKTFTVK